MRLLLLFVLITPPAYAQFFGLTSQQTYEACLRYRTLTLCSPAVEDKNLSDEQRNRAGQIYLEESKAASSPSPIVASSSMKEAEVAFQNFMWWVGTAFEVVFALVALLVIFFLFLKFSGKSEERTAWANLPAEGPMNVNIEEQYVEAGSFNSKHVPCGLKIDVKISQNDWRVIANAGLMKKVLFEADGPSGAQYDPENTRPWLVEDLKTPTYASFWDVQRMHQAKEELINSLVNLRATIEAQKEGRRETQFEI
jgi:hypothetical protein